MFFVPLDDFGCTPSRHRKRYCLESSPTNYDARSRGTQQRYQQSLTGSLAANDITDALACIVQDRLRWSVSRAKHLVAFNLEYVISVTRKRLRRVRVFGTKLPETVDELCEAPASNPPVVRNLLHYHAQSTFVKNRHDCINPCSYHRYTDFQNSFCFQVCSEGFKLVRVDNRQSYTVN